EVAVEDGVALVVAQRSTAPAVGMRVEHLATGGLQHRLAGRRVPFAGRAEARVDVHLPLREPAELQRGADADRLDLAHALHEAFGARIAVRAAGRDPQRCGGGRAHGDRAFLVAVAPERAPASLAVPEPTGHRRLAHAQPRPPAGP